VIEMLCSLPLPLSLAVDAEDAVGVDCLEVTSTGARAGGKRNPSSGRCRDLVSAAKLTLALEHVEISTLSGHPQPWSRSPISWWRSLGFCG